jgi:3-phenylpropionate/trans-cinnamate dioxygenase ferredoxin subunit
MACDFVKICAKADVANGAVKVVDVGSQRLALCHVDDQFFAVADLCTHDGGPLGEGELVDHQIECPRHGARFDIRTGKATCLPAVVPIPTYAIETRGEELWVSTQAQVASLER